jgi:hypothetical protein
MKWKETDEPQGRWTMKQSGLPRDTANIAAVELERESSKRKTTWREEKYFATNYIYFSVYSRCYAMTAR